MVRPLIAVLVFICTSTAFAASVSPDFSIMKMDHGQPGHMHECMKDAWKAAHPSDSQSQQAHDFMMQAKEVFDAQKDAIHESMKTLMGAWKKYPISEAEVESAETTMQGHVIPVHQAIRNAMINTLNLLTAEQRAAFDESMMSCMHNGHSSH